MTQPTIDPVSRRRFCGLTMATAATLAVGRPLLAADEASGYIDAHVHVWTPDTDKYPLDPSFEVSDMKPPSFTPEQLFRHTQPAGVDRVVLIQMSFYNHDNSYMLDMIARYPKVFSGVGIVDHESSNVAEKIKTLAQAGVRGLRVHARANEAKTWVNSEGMQHLWRTAANQGLAVCPLINPADLVHIDALCRKHPETRVVIDHFGRVGITGQIVQQELDSLCRLSRFPSVHVKTSAFYALGKKQSPYKDLLPMIRTVVDAFGPERLMWASDCPYQVQRGHSYDASIALIRDAAQNELSPSEKEWLLHRTAQKVFF